MTVNFFNHVLLDIYADINWELDFAYGLWDDDRYVGNGSFNRL
jgi:hypothetical protein